MSNNIESNICKAIDIIVKKAVNQASYDKTIQATILSCVDATIGKYKVKYQDSTFYAYSGNSDTTYTDGSNVYILIPGNDMKKDKTILGTTKKLGINYIATSEGEESYEPIGNNCISSSITFGLSSYSKVGQEKILYSRDFPNKNLIKVDSASAEEYIKQSANLICSMKVRTFLPPEQQSRGNYGIIFALDFLDNATNKTITRNYVIDVDKMTGNPYKLVYSTKQYGIFDIDGINFKSIKEIKLFCYNFPNSKENYIDDIFIEDLQFYGVAKLSEEDINGCSLSIITPQGNFFNKNANKNDYKKLQAQVRVKGKVIDNNSQKLPFYWFVEDINITSKSLGYHKYGGQGWRCLNKYNIIQDANEENGEAAIVEYVALDSEYKVYFEDVIAKETKYKCVVIYDESALEKQIVIKNYNSNYQFSLISDLGEQFYYDVGYPTLTCLMNGEQIKDTGNYEFSWITVDSIGGFSNLEETTAKNEEYNNAVKNKKDLEKAISDGTKYYEVVKDELDRYNAVIEKYNTITRVEKDKIIHIDVRSITRNKTYKCAVYYIRNGNKTFLGSASITLTNSLSTEGSYTLVINNGIQTFKYNENGISPASKSLEKPITLQALTFTIYNNLGQPIDDEVARHCKIKWIVPSKNTMLKISSDYNNVKKDEDLINNTTTYNNITTLTYSIEDKYSVNKVRNNIQLAVEYKEMNLITETNFTFVKEGESGTNGTDIVCKIVPNVKDGKPIPVYPILTKSGATYSFNFNKKDNASNFKIEIWKDGEIVFSGSTTSGNTTVVWSVLKNKYGLDYGNSSGTDYSFIQINSQNGNVTEAVTREEPLAWDRLGVANIIKAIVKYDGITYYATMPIIVAEIYNNNYKVNLKDYTGFRHVIYNADGRKPKYDNATPFTLEVKKYMSEANGYVDISTNSKTNYNWKRKGSILEYHQSSGINDSTRWEEKSSLHLIDISPKNIINQRSYKPVDDYDGQCVNSGIVCTIKDETNTNTNNNDPIANIYIPVHLYLNRFNNAAINDWDGNSVNVNSNGGFILSPQVGAGVKDSNNAFTGIVMGKVQEANQNNVEVGLFGYNKGQRNIFLDAETGKAVFGVNNGGQIILDPSDGKAEIKSGNYKDGVGGMLIDLTTPEIKFGTGYFSVNSNGYLTAKGGGSIAGWNIGDNTLSKGSVTLSSNDSEQTNKAFKVGNVFSVDYNGFLVAQQATIGSGTAKITVGMNQTKAYSAIYSGDKNGLQVEKNGFYLGTNGIGLGTTTNVKGKTVSRFQVDEEGNFYAALGCIGSGKDPLEITSNGLCKGKKTYNDNNEGVYLGSNGIGLGAKNFTVNSAGFLTAMSGKIGGWEIKSSSLTGTEEKKDKHGKPIKNSRKISLNPATGINFNDLFTVNQDGFLTATSGKIGGCTITASGISGSTDGGSSWNIQGNGTASFTNVLINGKSIISAGTQVGTEYDSNGNVSKQSDLPKYIGSQSGGALSSNLGNNDYVKNRASESDQYEVGWFLGIVQIDKISLDVKNKTASLWYKRMPFLSKGAVSSSDAHGLAFDYIGEK
ncbi:hypothetical protein [Megamonas funiformis]|uniref:hypothetical protein n=1 Tax=Megamonas funiformis TaxID=437897 RepID=UPI003F840047